MSYFDGLSTPHSAANLIQAQRDYFGAHTYERVDWERGKFFHTNWTVREERRFLELITYKRHEESR